MKKPSTLTLVNLFLLLLLGAGIVHDLRAQSFGDFLKNAAAEAARQAVGNQVRDSVTKAIDGAAKELAQPASADAARPSPQLSPQPASSSMGKKGCGRVRGAELALGARPESFQPAVLWPEPAACPVYAVGDLDFEKARAAKTAFREASKVRCNACEGGYDFDAWGGRSLLKSGADYSKEFPKLLLALEQGKSLGWKGQRYDVSITATGAHPLGAMPCKQFHYTLTEKGKLVAEYDGMYCEYTRPYIANPSWNEVV